MADARLPISITARHVGYTELLRLHEQLFTVLQDVHAPLPWWMQVHQKAKETHRAIDEQLMLATGDDLEARKERRCPTPQ